MPGDLVFLLLDHVIPFMVAIILYWLGYRRGRKYHKMALDFMESIRKTLMMEGYVKEAKIIEEIQWYLKHMLYNETNDAVDDIKKHIKNSNGRK